MSEERIQTQGPDAAVPREQDRPDPPVPDISTQEPSAREVFVAWEKLRILYNVAIVIPCLLVLSSKWFFWQLGGFGLGEGVIVLVVCNLVFSSGLIAEGYLCAMGLKRKPARWGSFVAMGLLTWFFVPAMLIGNIAHA